MPARTRTPPAAPRRGPGRRRRTGALVLALVTVLAGCGLRLETPSPTAPEPDEVEVVRQRTTADAVALRTLAGAAAPESAEGALARVVEVGALHADALGGVYTWEPPPPPGAPSPDRSPGPSPAPAPAATPQDVADALDDAAASARADAAAVPDGAMARLLASVAASRQLLAEAVRREAGLEGEEPTPFTVPEELPPGTSLTALGHLIQSEDALGMAWEVLAARTAADARAGFVRRAGEHRARAEAWATLADVDATGLDPRRSAYDLPDALLAPGAEGAGEALRALERELATSYASLVHDAQAGSRSPFVDGLTDAARHGWSAPGPPAFPGMPEQEG